MAHAAEVDYLNELIQEFVDTKKPKCTDGSLFGPECEGCSSYDFCMDQERQAMDELENDC